MPERIIENNIKNLFESDMVRYLIAVDNRRAFPDIKDGLKPVQRRIIYDMKVLGAISYAKRVKSQAVTGDLMKWLHPHGDQYSTLEPMAVWYKCKIPLLAPKGNWGNITGDSPAAARYTEAGLSNFCYENVIGELAETEGVVDWVENYLRTSKEPEYLPVKVPLLLINGAFGIGVGIQCNIPSHNLNEVCDATRKLLKNPNAKILLAPDHCQSCEVIISQEELERINRSGDGKYKIRGRIEITEENGAPLLRVTSLPDGVSSSSVEEKINELIGKKQLPMVKDCIDASQGTVDIRVYLKKGSDPNYVKEILYRTGVQSTFRLQFRVVDGTQPILIGYKDYLLRFIENRKLTKFRRYCNKYRDNKTRVHKLETYIMVIESGKLDMVINKIRKQKTIDDNEIMEYLIKTLNITDLQAKFIMDTNIKQLSAGYLAKYKAEFAERNKNLQFYEQAITDGGKIITDEIDQELQEIAKKYGSPRLCTILDDKFDNDIPKGIFKVVVTRKNYIRKIPDTDKIGVVRGDDPKFIVRVDNCENILLFDNKGKVFKLPVHKIPVSDRSSAGTDVRILCKNLTADIISVLYEPAIKKIVDASLNGGKKHYIATVSKKNQIKKLDMMDFLNVSTSGLMYTKIKDQDEVTGLVITPGDLDIVVYSKNKALRTGARNIPLYRRNAVGNKAMNTQADIEGLSVVYPDAKYIVVLTEKGKVNKFPIDCLAAHDRARSGVNVIKLGQYDAIQSIFGANDSDELRIVTSDTVLEVNVADIKCKSPVAVGDLIPIKGATIVRTDLIKK